MAARTACWGLLLRDADSERPGKTGLLDDSGLPDLHAFTCLLVQWLKIGLRDSDKDAEARPQAIFSGGLQAEKVERPLASVRRPPRLLPSLTLMGVPLAGPCLRNVSSVSSRLTTQGTARQVSRIP